MVIIPVSVSRSSLHHLFDDLFEVLVVGVVSGRSQDGVTVHLKRIRNCQICTFIYSDSWRGSVDSDRHLHETRDVPEASQRAVRAQHVRRDDDAAGELHTEHRRPCDHRVPAGRRRREPFTLSCDPLISSDSLQHLTIRHPPDSVAQHEGTSTFIHNREGERTQVTSA